MLDTILYVVAAGVLVYLVVNIKESQTDTTSPVSKPGAKPAVASKNKTAATKPAAAATKDKTAVAKPVVAKPAATKPATTAKIVGDNSKIPKGMLRNPETGDQDKIGTSYPMSKRWIKDALVAEGLLDRVYKVDEMNDIIKLRANAALAQMLQLDKYK